MFTENLEQIGKLINMVSSSDITELSVKEGNLEITVRKTPKHPHGVNAAHMPYATPMLNPMSMGIPGFDARMQPQPMQAASSAVPPIPPMPVPAAPVSGKQEIPEGNRVESPLVGTFYAASSPDSEPFVKKGDTVKKGQVLGIVEAMKLMNEIECEFDGVVADILVANGDMVEYGQPLFIIK